MLHKVLLLLTIVLLGLVAAKPCCFLSFLKPHSKQAPQPYIQPAQPLEIPSLEPEILDTAETFSRGGNWKGGYNSAHHGHHDHQGSSGYSGTGAYSGYGWFGGFGNQGNQGLGWRKPFGWKSG